MPQRHLLDIKGPKSWTEAALTRRMSTKTVTCLNIYNIFTIYLQYFYNFIYTYLYSGNFQIQRWLQGNGALALAQYAQLRRGRTDACCAQAPRKESCPGTSGDWRGRGPRFLDGKETNAVVLNDLNGGYRGIPNHAKLDVLKPMVLGSWDHWRNPQMLCDVLRTVRPMQSLHLNGSGQ